MAQAFSLLIQEEKQREFKPAGRMPMESTSLNARVLNNKVKGGRTFQTNNQNNNYAEVLIPKEEAVQEETIIIMVVVVIRVP